MYRTVELTCKAKDLVEVLSSLKLTEKFKNNSAFTLQVDIEDVKENYESLCKSDKILDWKLISNNSNSPQLSCGNDCCSKGDEEKPQYFTETPEEAINFVASELEEGRVLKILKESLNPLEISDISNILVSVWSNLRTNSSSKLKFSSLFFKEIVVPYVLKRRDDIDNTIGGMNIFIDAYYNGADIDEVLIDVIKKVRANWEHIGYISTFPMIGGLLFGPNKETLALYVK